MVWSGSDLNGKVKNKVDTKLLKAKDVMRTVIIFSLKSTANLNVNISMNIVQHNLYQMDANKMWR